MITSIACDAFNDPITKTRLANFDNENGIGYINTYLIGESQMAFSLLSVAVELSALSKSSPGGTLEQKSFSSC